MAVVVVHIILVVFVVFRFILKKNEFALQNAIELQWVEGTACAINEASNPIPEIFSIAAWDV